MGFFQSIFGTETGAGYQAHGVTNPDLTNAAGQVDATQVQQNQLLAALQGQGGVGNQANVYGQQQALLQQLQGAGGVQNQQGAIQGLQGLVGQQQGLASQYQNLANGVGPNPAQAQLAQNTAANVAQTGALMAGQRGAGQNVGLMARQAGQQGAQTQQGAVGQAATLQAQQQLQGMQGLAQQQQAIGGTQQAIAGLGGQQIGQLQGQQTNTANLATQQVGQQLAAQQQAAQTALSNQQNIYGLQSNINTTNAGVASQNAKAQAGLIGGILGSAGAAGNAGASGSDQTQQKAMGGEVRQMAGGGMSAPQVQTPNAPVANGGPSSFARFLQQTQAGFNPTQDAGASGQQSGQGIYQLGKAAYQGGKSLYNYANWHMPRTIDSGTGATDLPNETGNIASTDSTAGAAGDTSTVAEAGEAAEGAEAAEAGDSIDSLVAALAAHGGSARKDLKRGGKVNASSSKQKAKSSGDNYGNDKIPAVLSEHEIVLPRSVTLSKDPIGNSAKFVASVLAKRGKR